MPEFSFDGPMSDEKWVELAKYHRAGGSGGTYNHGVFEPHFPEDDKDWMILGLLNILERTQKELCELEDAIPDIEEEAFLEGVEEGKSQVEQKSKGIIVPSNAGDTSGYNIKDMYINTSNTIAYSNGIDIRDTWRGFDGAR